jgi:hypothetical protein
MVLLSIYQSAFSVDEFFNSISRNNLLLLWWPPKNNYFCYKFAIGRVAGTGVHPVVVGTSRLLHTWLRHKADQTNQSKLIFHFAFWADSVLREKCSLETSRIISLHSLLNVNANIVFTYCIFICMPGLYDTWRSETVLKIKFCTEKTVLDSL